MWGNYTMRNELETSFHIREVDFVAGRYYVNEGWKMIPGFVADIFLFVARTDETKLEIWDADKFRRDEHFGSIVVSESDSGHGPIAGVAALGGAHYVLTYRVTADS